MLAKKISVLFVIACLLVTLASCGSSSSPERVTEIYFSAVKAGDMEKAIECFTPSIQEQYKAAMSIYNSLLGMFGLGLDCEALLGAAIGTVNTEEYKNYDFKVTDSTKIDDSHAEVFVDVYVDGEKSLTTTIRCVKIDTDWYIEE